MATHTEFHSMRQDFNIIWQKIDKNLLRYLVTMNDIVSSQL